MKRLWKSIPPCLSDVMGFQAVINETEGFGIVDDPSTYKFVPLAGEEGHQRGGGGRPSGGFGGHGGFEGKAAGRSEGGFEKHGKPGLGGGREGFGGHGGRGHEGGFGGHGSFGGDSMGRGEGRGGRGEGGKPAGMPGQRLVTSNLRNEDIITGTEAKLMEAFENGVKVLGTPDFVLLCNAPSSSMISSDLEGAAEKITGKGQIPAGRLNIHGDKDYAYGASQALEGIGRLILEPGSKQEKTVNILGCNRIDWLDEETDELKKALEAAGWKVLSAWGARHMTTASLKESTDASVNLVVNVSGMALAEYMQQEFDIPFVAGAPFGKKQLTEILKLLEEAAGKPGERFALPYEPCEGGPEALVIGEQFRAAAIRAALAEKGYKNIKVLSFMEMEKSLMAGEDRKLNSEDDLEQAASAESVRLIAGAPDFMAAAKRDDVKWISLTAESLSPVEREKPVNMIGGRLEEFLNK